MSRATTSKKTKRKTARRASANGTISISDVAKHANVSLGTVSRVLNRHPSVGSDLRKKVLASSRSLGFVPKVSHRCVAVITGRYSPAMPIGYVSAMTSLVSQELASRGMAVELIDIGNIELAYEAHIDGVIGIVFDQRLTELTSIPNLPIVSINKPMVEHGIGSVYADHYQQAEMACKYLLQQGHREIAFMEIERGEWGSCERTAAFCDVMNEAGLIVDPSRICYTIEQPVYDILSRWCQRGVTGILNFSEDVSLEAIHILSNVLSKQIGRDISTISLEDVPIYQYLTPPQTVVRQPLAEMAKIAVDNIIKQVEDKDSTQVIDIKLETQLIERDSVVNLSI
ncbi:LacI family DNA-binding transcriptional regulator [Poriferisphaera corsica]|nr:LacI family DNA-binding transcriptional regulator [Poriferisphaera corsica]